MKSIQWSEDSLEPIADELAASAFCVIRDFLPRDLLEELRQVALHHHAADSFKKAGIGNFYNFQVDKGIRGDKIKWIDKQDALAPTQQFLTRIESLMAHLNRLLFLSLKDYECHFAIYPPGTFYEKHLDQFKNTNNRKISFAFYLNKNWQAAHGGELRIYHNDSYIDVPPLANSLALFRSDCVEHEVRITHENRYSITGWMLDRPINLPYV